jgi:PAS domain S-box-containing protein
MANPLKVLLVEDSRADALLLIDQLRQGGYDPTYTRVASPEAMQQAFAHERWELVLADYSMPHFSGPAALELFKAQQLEIPFIVVSATVTEQQAIDMMRAGANDFILKQSLGRLIPAIQRELRETEIRRERRRALDALQEREQRLGFIVEHSLDSIFIQDTELRYLWVSKPAYPLTQQDYLGHTDFELLPRDDAERLAEIKRRVLAEERGLTVEIPLTLKGHARIYDATYEPWRSTDGQIIGIAGYVRDVTDRVAAARALERERAFLLSAIELLPFPIIFNTPFGEVIRANHAGYAFFGDLSSTAWWNRQLLDPQTRQPLSRECWPMMIAARGEVVPQADAILVLPDGREVDVLAVAAPIYVGNILVATVMAFLDITAIKEADRAKTRFLAVLSHQLRTPLTNILGWAKEAQELPEVVPDALRIILRYAEEQRRMLENLLEVSRLLHGHLELQRVPSDLWALAEEVVQAMALEATDHHITLEVVPPAHPLPVLADRKRLRAVVENVLENALHFSTAGGRITLHGASADGLATLSVQDRGRGIAPEMLPRVFDLFQVSPDVEQTGGGLGLGLPLAKVILERHGGWITVASPGSDLGTTVTLAVPMEGE